MNSDVEDFIQSLEESGANLPDNFPFSADGTDDEESDGRAPAINFQKLINSMPGTSEDRKDGKEKGNGKKQKEMCIRDRFCALRSCCARQACFLPTRPHLSDSRTVLSSCSRRSHASMCRFMNFQ